MASDRNKHRVERVVKYVALVEFHGPPGEHHYVVGEEFTTEGWPAGSVESSIAWGIMKQVDEPVAPEIPSVGEGGTDGKNNG